MATVHRCLPKLEESQRIELCRAFRHVIVFETSANHLALLSEAGPYVAALHALMGLITPAGDPSKLEEGSGFEPLHPLSEMASV